VRGQYEVVEARAGPPSQPRGHRKTRCALLDKWCRAVPAGAPDNQFVRSGDWQVRVVDLEAPMRRLPRRAGNRYRCVLASTPADRRSRGRAYLALAKM